MKKLTRTASALICAAALTITGAAPSFGQTPNLTAQAVDTNNDDWLHAEGSRLYDMNGNEVWLTGANWFGMNCTENVPHGLYARDVDDMLQTIADHGINIISCVTSDAKVAGEKEMTITADLSQAGMGIIEEIREAGYTVTNITTSRAK